MPLDRLTALDRQPVSAAVHGRLRAAILAGELEPGEALPSERALAERFGVNRHAVREALKRLQQARLVEIAQGGATRVLDWRATGGIELLLDVATARPEPDVVRAILEFRAALGADVARRCAQRGGPEPHRRAAALAQQVLDGRRDPDDRAARYEELWQAIVDGAGNLGYRLAYNTLLDGQHLVGAALRRIAPEMDDRATLTALLDALAAADADAAHEAARLLLEPAAR